MTELSDKKAQKLTAIRDAAPLNAGIESIKRMEEISLLTDDELDQLKLIHPRMSNRTALNKFREIRTRMMQLSQKKNFVVMVTSVCAQGGASFVSANMAASFSLDKTKTALLIDCNLYDPPQGVFLNASGEYGLTDYLVDPTIRVEDIIYASGISRLRMMPLGRHVESAAEHFSSERMSQLINAIKKRYPDRFVFIDAPPVTTSAETNILSELSDFVVLVVPYGKVTHSQIQASVESVSGARLAGIIFNN